MPSPMLDKPAKRYRATTLVKLTIVSLALSLVSLATNVPARAAQQCLVYQGHSSGDATLAADFYLEGQLNRGFKILHEFYLLTDPPATSWFNAVLAHGAVPMLTLEPDSPIVDPLHTIVAGTYNSQIDAWANALKNAGSINGWPHFRFAHEMQGSWYLWGDRQGNSPADYVATYRYVHDRVKAIAPNLFFDWTPYRNFASTYPMMSYYPGDAYVDYVGFSAYNWGTSRTGTTWEPIDQVVSETYGILRVGAPSKSIMLPEWASSEMGGSKANWITDAPNKILSFPAITIVVWFGQGTDWPMTSSPAALTAAKSAFGGISPPFCPPFP